MNWTIQLRILYMAGFRLGPDTTRRVGEKKSNDCPRWFRWTKITWRRSSFSEPGRLLPTVPLLSRWAKILRQTTQCEAKTKTKTKTYDPIWGKDKDKDRRPNVRQRQRQRQRHTTQFEAKTKTKTDDPMWGKDKRPNVRTKRVFLLLTNSIICFKTKYNLRKIQRANKNDITPPKEEVSRVFFTSPALR